METNEDFRVVNGFLSKDTRKKIHNVTGTDPGSSVYLMTSEGDE